VALQAISFGSTIVVARLLDPTDYGLMALAGIWTSIIALLAELGLGAAIVQFPDLDDRELNTCFWMIMAVAVVGYWSLFVGAPIIAVWFGSPPLSAVLRVTGLALLLVAVRVVPDSLLRRRLELDRISRAEVVAALVTIPAVVGMAWAGAGVWALVTGALVAPFVQNVVIFTLTRWRPGLKVGGPRVRVIFHYSLAMLGSRICWAVYEQADAFVLGKVSGDVSLGFYSMAKQLVLFPVEKVSGMVNQLAAPVMAELQFDREAMRAAFLKGVRLVAWVTFPLCIGLMLVARDLVQVMLTDRWMTTVPVIRVLGLYALVRSLAVLLPPVLMAQYRAKFLFSYNMVLLGIMPMAFWGGAIWGGAVGVALAWVAVYPVILASMVREAMQAVELPWKALCRQLWPPVAATSAMAVSVLLLRRGISSFGSELGVGRLTLMIVIGGAAYCAVLLQCGARVRGEIQEVAGWLFRREHALSKRSQDKNPRLSDGRA